MAQSRDEFVSHIIAAMVTNSRYSIISGGVDMPPDMVAELTDSMTRLADPIWDMTASWALGLDGDEFPDERVRMSVLDPLTGYLGDKIDDDSIKYDSQFRLYVNRVPLASNLNPGGVVIGGQPYLYMNGTNLMLNAETDSLLIGGHDMVPTSRAVKLYVDSIVTAGGGGGDMLKSTYDTNNSGVVDDSERLNNQLPSYYLNWANFTGIPTSISGYGITDTYTKTEIDLFFDGESVGKKQVSWANILNKELVISLLGDGGNTRIAIFNGINTLSSSADLIFYAGQLEVGAGILTGISWDPTLDQHVATKLYVDSNIGVNANFEVLHNNVACPAGQITYIVVGDTSRDIGIQIRYSIIRGSLYESGVIYLLNKAGIITMDRSSFGDASGVSISKSVSGTDIRLNVTVPAGSNATFGYVKVHDDGPNTWLGLNSPDKSITITADSYTLFPIAQSGTHTSTKVQYGISRGASFQVGEFTVLNKGGVLQVDIGSVGGNVGCTFTSEINNGIIYLKAHLTPGVSATMNYMVSYDDGPRNWDINVGFEKVVTLSNNAENIIVIGNKYDYTGFEIYYDLVRGTSAQTGKALISDNGTITPLKDITSFGDLCGVTYDVTTDANGNIQWKIIADNSGSSIDLTYRVLYIDKPFNWDNIISQIGGNNINALIKTPTATEDNYAITWDNSANQYVLTNLTIGTYWDRVGTDIIPSTTGDNVLIPITSKITFGDGDTYIQQLTNDKLEFLANSTAILTLTSDTIWAYNNIFPSPTLTHSLGSVDNRWFLVYANQFRLDDAIISQSGTELKFYDPINGHVFLSDLITKSYWRLSGNYLIPGTAGNDILLATTTERLVFGDGDTYIHEFEDDQLYIVTNGITVTGFSTNGIYTTVDLVTSNNNSIGAITSFWNNIYATKYYIDTTSAFINLTLNEITFTDSINGTKRLSELLAGTAYWQKVGTNISPSVAGDDILLNINERILFSDADTYIGELSDNILQVIINGYVSWQFEQTFSTTYRNVIPSGFIDLGSTTAFWYKTYTDILYLKNIGTSIQVDVSGNMTFTDIHTSAILSDLIGGGTNYLQRVGTDLKPLNAGDDILLAVSSERLRFGDGDTYIYESADDVLDILTEGASNFQFSITHNTSYKDLIPYANKVVSLGTTSYYWDLICGNRLNLYEDANYIGGTSTTMEFIVGNTIQIRLNDTAGIYVFDDIIPQGTSLTLGNFLQFFGESYINKVYINNINTYIDVSGTDMTFTSAAAGTVTLASLGIGGSYTFTNGLIESAGTVRLGGNALTANTIIDLGNQSLTIRDSNPGAGISSAALFSNSNFMFAGYRSDDWTYTNGLAAVQVTSGYIDLMYKATGSNTFRQLLIDDDEIKFRDDITNKGVTYDADYSANFTARSLVDKEYVYSVEAFQYTTTPPSTPVLPTAGIRFINIQNSSEGTIYDLNIDLDNLEYVGKDTMVLISYSWTNSSIDFHVRNSLDVVLQQVLASASLQKGAWLFMWDGFNNRWNSVVMTAH